MRRELKPALMIYSSPIIKTLYNMWILYLFIVQMKRCRWNVLSLIPVLC